MRRCRICASPLEVTFVDLGSMPLANALVDPDLAEAADPSFPLHARLCTQCHLVQVDDAVPPDEIFSEYAYFSSYSDSWLRHARSFCERAVTELSLDETSLVVELASNDGYLLVNLVEAGIQCYGVEPAGNVAEVARSRGVDTVKAFFTAEIASDLVSERGNADLVVANNVLAHVPDPNDFVEGMRVLVGDRGVASVEVPHLARLIDSIAFDTIYHEHFSYFSLGTMAILFGMHGLEVYRVEELPTHGGSLRVWVAPAGTRRVDPSVGRVLEEEEAMGMRTLDPYLRFATKVERCREEFLDFVSEAKALGQRLGAYGAAAKGATFLNYCGVTETEIGVVADRSPHKQGRLMPGSRIPIVGPEALEADPPDLVVVLAWNLFDEIAGQLEALTARGSKLVTAVPSVTVRA